MRVHGWSLGSRWDGGMMRVLGWCLGNQEGLGWLQYELVVPLWSRMVESAFTKNKGIWEDALFSDYVETLS